MKIVEIKISEITTDLTSSLRNLQEFYKGKLEIRSVVNSRRDGIMLKLNNVSSSEVDIVSVRNFLRCGGIEMKMITEEPTPFLTSSSSTTHNSPIVSTMERKKRARSLMNRMMKDKKTLDDNITKIMSITAKCNTSLTNLLEKRAFIDKTLCLLQECLCVETQ